MDYIDPGKTYYTYAIGIINVAPPRRCTPIRRSDGRARPDLAADMPEISEDGKTVTVKLKQGVTFSPPVSREVTSADVKYAIERAFTANVANGYAGVYFGDLDGAPKEHGKYKEIKGIETPDDSDDRLQPDQGHRRGAGRRARHADLGPGAEGVRARSTTRRSPSTYGEGHAVYTGPYMVESDAEGKVTGYVPGKTIKHRPQPGLRARSTTSARRSSTRSRSRPATTTAPSPRAAS